MSKVTPDADRSRDSMLIELEEHERALLDLLPPICPTCHTMRLSDDDLAKTASHASRMIELRNQLGLSPAARKEPVAFALGGAALEDFTQPVSAWKLSRGQETLSGAFCLTHLSLRYADGWTAEPEKGWFTQPGTKTLCPDCQLS